MIFSSSVPCVTRRYTLTTRFWPMRWARSIACRSFMGFQSCSTKITWNHWLNRLYSSSRIFPEGVIKTVRHKSGSQDVVTYCVSTSQVQTKPSDLSGEEQQVNRWVAVEALNQWLPCPCWHCPIQPQVSDTWQVNPEKSSRSLGSSRQPASIHHLQSFLSFTYFIPGQ